MKNTKLASIVLKIKGGDQAAFDELYRATWDTVYYIALKFLDNPQDAQDAAQESFIQIHKDIHKLKHANAFNSWLNRIVFHTCLRISKKQKNYELDALEDFESHLVEDNPDFLPEEVLANRELCESVARTVSELPDEQKTAILLYYFEQMSVDSIADTLNTTPNAIALKLYKARNTMKSKLEILKKKGIPIHSIATLPVLSRILLNEATEVCTPEIGEEILKGVKTAIAATAGTAAAAIPKPAAKSMSVGAKITIGVVSAGIVAGSAFAIAGLLNRTPDAPPVESRVEQPAALEISSQPAVTPESEPESEPRSELESGPESEAAVSTETRIRTIEDLVGDSDADLMRSWTTLTDSGEAGKFDAFLNRHDAKMHSLFYDIDETDPGRYSFYTIARQDKNLLMVQYLNVETGEFCVAYSFEKIGDTVLENRYIKEWFHGHAEAN